MASYWKSKVSHPYIEDVSLAELARRFSGIELGKEDKLRCGNWEALTLSEAEVVSSKRIRL